ncbi:MAG: hypothetical protein H6831_14605 [Planctomycetes bacterium]|nr:hypothetical protein [Planctomycetota bacterium]MCB9905634.1 hypothetical protein [Planctomycetota bacterium]
MTHRPNQMNGPSMRPLRFGALAALGLLIPACSSGGGSSSGGQMFLESCSLGCGSGSTGTPVNCQTVNVAQNLVVSMVFSKPVNQNTLNSQTFLLQNSISGTVPAVGFSIDPTNPRRIIARPAISFDDQNNPNYALAPDTTYELLVRGASTGGNGPFIRSLDGKDNQTNLNCTVFTDQGIKDPVPGPPIQSTFVTVNDGMGGTIPDTPADGATEVALDSLITVVFEDIMNPATLSNPTTRTATFVTTKIDPDGNVADPADQVEIAGFYDTVVDFDNLRTVMTFTPAAGLPSAGTDPLNPRKVVMRLPAALEDLTGKPLANPGDIVFTTSTQLLPPVVLPEAGGEKFLDTDNQDPDESGANWGAGRLTYGLGGGAGRLGELVVRSGQTVVLNTDSQDFPLASQYDSLLTNESIGNGDYVATDPGTWPTITVTNGSFDFSRLVIEANATLVLEGSQPGRVFSRGSLVVGGVLNCAGKTPVPHISNTWRLWDSDGVGGVDPPDALDEEAAYGGAGGLGGPNAGAGGKGADRYFYEVDQPNATVYNRLSSAGMISYNDDPVATNQGSYGRGVSQLGTLAAGPGGAPYPVVPPGDTNPATSFWGSTNLSFTNTIAVTNDCRTAMVAGPGGGGAYALDGGPGIPRSDTFTVTEVPQVLPTVPANTPGGSNNALNLEPPGEVIIRSLDHRLGLLRGGSGGGGGGAHFWGSRVLRQPAPSTLCNAASLVLPMWDHSAAGGGGGGGAFQGVSGREVLVGGVIDTSGGDGGSALANNAPLDNCRSGATSGDPNYPGLDPNILACGSNATPGGGGSGGSLKLQGQTVTLADLPNRLSVAGGQGGVGVGGSTGGNGSPGLVRIEFQGFSGDQGTHAGDYAPRIEPYLPADTGFNTPFESAAILSIGEFRVQRIRPDSFSSSMSCWMKPEGNFFGLDFAADDTVDPDDPDGKNWNMDIIYDDNGTERMFPYRGLPAGDPDFPLGSVDFETFLGDNQINHDLPSGQGSLISVHFQGARLSGALTDPCNVQLESPGADIDLGSLTTWVTDPEDLNQFLPKPNMVRFVVVFEQRLQTQGPVQQRILGLTNLRVNVQPN